MVLFGLGEVLGCFFIGAIVDKFGSKMAVFANIGIILTMGGVTFAFSYIWEFNALAWVMTFMWGFQDSALNTHTSEMLGFEFDDNYTPFSLFNIWQSISCFTFQIVNSYFDSRDLYLYSSIGYTAFALICCGFTYWFPFREHRANTVTVRSILGSFSAPNGRKNSRLLPSDDPKRLIQD
jgi:MFS family permease